MARVQPVLTPTETALVDQMAELTGAKRTDVLKSAITVYHWFLRQTLTGNRVISRSQSGQETALQTPELALLEGNGHRLPPQELGHLANQLANTTDPVEAAQLRERLTQGFYAV